MIGETVRRVSLTSSHLFKWACPSVGPFARNAFVKKSYVQIELVKSTPTSLFNQLDRLSDRRCIRLIADPRAKTPKDASLTGLIPMSLLYLNGFSF